MIVGDQLEPGDDRPQPAGGRGEVALHQPVNGLSRGADIVHRIVAPGLDFFQVEQFRPHLAIKDHRVDGLLRRELYLTEFLQTALECLDGADSRLHCGGRPVLQQGIILMKTRGCAFGGLPGEIGLEVIVHESSKGGRRGGRIGTMRGDLQTEDDTQKGQRKPAT